MLPVLPCDIEGRYTVVAELGRGSHAIVYQAHDRVLERDVAIKVLREELVDSSVRERFRREIRLTSRLDHPNIAHVYGTGEWRGAPYFVIALARGPSLADRLSREHQLPVDEALSITRQVAAALGHAHKASIIHRDVKPGNILLTPDGALLTDFGVARAIEHSSSTLATSTGTAVGTLQYMSPEQLCAEKGVDGRSDQYELALVLYEMLAGVPPHVAANIEGLRALRLVGQQVPVRTHRPSVSVAVEQAIERALCPTPADRFGSMGEFVAALDGGDSGSGALRVSASRRTLVAQMIGAGSAPRTGARRWLMPGIAALGVAAAAILAAPRLQRAGLASPIADATAAASMFSLSPVGDTTRSAPVVRALSDELSAWPDVQAGAATPTDARREAGTPIEVRATNLDGGTQVTAQLRTGGVVRRVMMRLPAGDVGSADSLRLLAGRVLMAAMVSPDSAERLTVVRERPTAAVRKFGEAWASLLSGDLGEAEVRFAEAGRSGAVPQAVLWQAIVGSWRQPKAPAAWREAARLAAERSGEMIVRDSIISMALHFEASDRIVDGCASFASATRIDGGPFVAWYGLANCLQKDSVVVRDAHSPTGSRFRTSHWGALEAYSAAVERLPSVGLVPLFDRLPEVSMALNASVRRGWQADAGGGAFAGLSGLAGDSVVVWPLPMSRFASGERAVVPATYQQAIRLSRTRLLSLTRQIAQRAPFSVAAQFAYARALELAGVLQAPASSASARNALSAASRLARTKADSIDVASAQVRVALRSAGFAEARAIAAQALRSIEPSTADEQTRFAILAMLINRPDLAEALATRAFTAAGSASHPGGLPAATAALVARYHVAAASTDCGDARTQRAAAIGALRSRFSPNELSSAIAQWITPADWAALSCDGATPPADLAADNPVARTLVALASGDTAGAARILRDRAKRRAGASESTLAWDTRQLELALTLRATDSSATRRLLELAFDQIEDTMDFILHDFAQVAGLRRALTLCAELPLAQQVLTNKNGGCRAAIGTLNGTQ